MLPKQYRATSHQHQAAAQLRPDVVWRGKYLILRTFHLPKTLIDLKNPRFSVSVSKKKAKLAVERNHLRRVVYQALEKTKETDNDYQKLLPQLYLFSVVQTTSDATLFLTEVTKALEVCIAKK